MKREMSFKEALKRLETIIENLEDDIDDLDKVVNLFEEGSELVSLCSKKLDEVETRIETITKKMNDKDRFEDRDKNEE